jgi:hypothetical protein
MCELGSIQDVLSSPRMEFSRLWLYRVLLLEVAMFKDWVLMGWLVLNPKFRKLFSSPLPCTNVEPNMLV